MELTIKSKAYGDMIILIDEEDYIKIVNYAINLKKKQNGFYAYLLKGYWAEALHRYLLRPPKGIEVDHINRNPLDNRRSNLRLGTHAQNSRNKFQKNSPSGFKGVYWAKDKKKWCSRITYNSKVIQGGYFNCKIDAAYAYNDLAIKYHKEFAYLNTFTQADNKQRLNEPRYTKENRRCESGYRGVSAMAKRFVAHIRINNKKVHLGCFGTALEAAAEFNKKAIEVYGENAIINKI